MYLGKYTSPMDCLGMFCSILSELWEKSVINLISWHYKVTFYTPARRHTCILSSWVWGQICSKQTGADGIWNSIGSHLKLNSSQHLKIDLPKKKTLEDWIFFYNPHISMEKSLKFLLVSAKKKHISLLPEVWDDHPTLGIRNHYHGNLRGPSLCHPPPGNKALLRPN